MTKVVCLSQPIIERYEYKYHIPTSAVPNVRGAVKLYCRPDAASRRGPYLISSLYLDSPNRVLYRQSVERQARRCKLRVRRYVGSPFFLEVKRRYKQVVTKDRLPIDPRHWPSILTDSRAVCAGRVPPAETERLDAFLDIALRLWAEPAVVVRYTREAFVSRFDRYARVTFDYRLEASMPTGHEVPIADDAAGWIPFDDPSQFSLPTSGVILELKCTTAVPVWMEAIVRCFGLRASGFSKYCSAVDVSDGVRRDPGAAMQASHRLFGAA